MSVVFGVLKRLEGWISNVGSVWCVKEIRGMNSVSGCDPNLHLSSSRKTETKDMDYILMAVFQPLYRYLIEGKNIMAGCINLPVFGNIFEIYGSMFCCW